MRRHRHCAGTSPYISEKQMTRGSAGKVKNICMAWHPSHTMLQPFLGKPEPLRWCVIRLLQRVEISHQYKGCCFQPRLVTSVVNNSRSSIIVIIGRHHRLPLSYAVNRNRACQHKMQESRVPSREDTADRVICSHSRHWPGQRDDHPAVIFLAFFLN